MDLTTYPTTYLYKVSIDGTEQPSLQKSGSVLDGFTVILNGSPFNVPTLTLQQYLAMEPVNVQLRLDRLKLYLEVCDNLTEEFTHTYVFSASPTTLNFDHDDFTGGVTKTVAVQSTKDGLLTGWGLHPTAPVPPFVATTVNPSSLVVAVNSNNNSGSTRSGIIKIKQTESPNEKDITVVQTSSVPTFNRKFTLYINSFYGSQTIITVSIKENSTTIGSGSSFLAFGEVKNPDFAFTPAGSNIQDIIIELELLRLYDQHPINDPGTIFLYAPPDSPGNSGTNLEVYDIPFGYGHNDNPTRIKLRPTVDANDYYAMIHVLNQYS